MTKLTKKRYALLPFALIMLAEVIALDVYALHRPVLAEGRPRFDAVHVLRSGLIALACLLAVVAAAPLSAPDTVATPASGLSDAFSSWGEIKWVKRDRPVPLEIASFRTADLLLLVVVFLSMLFIHEFLIDPVLFSKTGGEDKPVEALSAILCFISAATFLRVWSLLRKSSIPNRRVHLAISCLFAVAFFAIGMEEISWFQRVFGVGTPRWFPQNYQKEINLHNFVTNQAEVAYYFSAFLLLVFAPFANGHLQLIRPTSTLGFYLPSRIPMFVSSVFVSYNYDMWNTVPTQLSFFATIFILAHYAQLSVKLGKDRLVTIGVLALCVLTQATFLAFGDNFVRVFDVTEYKEFFIALSFAVYSLDVAQRARWDVYGQVSRSAESASGPTSHSP